MDLLCIANNIKGNYDGIGKHARIVGQAFKDHGAQIDYCTGTTWNKSLLQKFFSLQMCKAFVSAIFKMLHGNYDYIIIEYPFMEYNPLILIFHWMLFFLSRFIHTRIAFSMHEYDRVSPMRRLIIDGFLPFCDIIFISEEKYKTELSRYAMKMYVRRIPSHEIKYTPGEKNFDKKKQYCYFGLVNRSKAFEQMMNAWQRFNTNSKCVFDVVTNTDLSDYHLEKYNNVHYHYQLSDIEAGEMLSKCVYAIVPVVPNIGLNNSSFVTTIQCGCIPIGRYNDELINEPFVISTDSYDLLPFCNVLKESQKLSSDELIKRSKIALAFGQKFSVQKTVDMMIEGFESYEKKKNRKHEK